MASRLAYLEKQIRIDLMPKTKERTEPLTSLGGPPWTKKELCEWANGTPRFLEIEVTKGHFCVVRLGNRCVRFLPSDIRSWQIPGPRCLQPMKRQRLCLRWARI